MMGIQRRRGGAKRWIRYCLLLVCASSIGSLDIGCNAEESQPTARDQSARTSSSPSSTSASTSTSPSTAGSSLPVDAKPSETPVIVFLGTSLTAGYGLPENQAFPALIQEELDAAKLEYRVVNAGVSGDTSAGGLRRLDWLLRLPIAVLVLELGANDMLRGLNVDELNRNLEGILERTTEVHPNASFLVAGMRAAPNLGSDYRESFDRVYPELAERNGAELIPFLLEGVAAQRNLNQADGIHPTAEGHALIADRVWRKLEGMLPTD